MQDIAVQEYLRLEKKRYYLNKKNRSTQQYNNNKSTTITSQTRQEQIAVDEAIRLVSQCMSAEQKSNCITGVFRLMSTLKKDKMASIMYTYTNMYNK